MLADDSPCRATTNRRTDSSPRAPARPSPSGRSRPLLERVLACITTADLTSATPDPHGPNPRCFTRFHASHVHISDGYEVSVQSARAASGDEVEGLAVSARRAQACWAHV